jgi:hypothetical protein
MDRVAVGLGMHGDGPQPEAAARAPGCAGPISPRLAINTLSNIIVLNAKREACAWPGLDLLARCDEHRLHGRIALGTDFVEDLHRLDDTQRLAGLDRLPDRHERRLAGRRPEVHDAIQRREHIAGRRRFDHWCRARPCSHRSARCASGRPHRHARSGWRALWRSGVASQPSWLELHLLMVRLDAIDRSIKALICSGSHGAKVPVR